MNEEADGCVKQPNLVTCSLSVGHHLYQFKYITTNHSIISPNEMLQFVKKDFQLARIQYLQSFSFGGRISTFLLCEESCSLISKRPDNQGRRHHFATPSMFLIPVLVSNIIMVVVDYRHRNSIDSNLDTAMARILVA